jgi:pyruvate carboxylase subunit B
LARSQGREFFTGNPQDLYPDELEIFAQQMQEKGWDLGEDDEELMEYAMHTPQYEAYKNGKAKEDFLKDLESKKATKVSTTEKPTTATVTSQHPQQLNIEVNGKSFDVRISYPGHNSTEGDTTKDSEQPTNPGVSIGDKPINAPLEGKFYLTKDSSEKGIQVGDEVQSGDTVAYIESMKVINAVTSPISGTVTEIVAKHGEEVEEDDILIMLS